MNRQHTHKNFHRPTMEALNYCRSLELAAAQGNHRCQCKEHDCNKRAPLKATAVVVSLCWAALEQVANPASVRFRTAVCVPSQFVPGSLLAASPDWRRGDLCRPTEWSRSILRSAAAGGSTAGLAWLAAMKALGSLVRSATPAARLAGPVPSFVTVPEVLEGLRLSR